jgi:hypothetical protein
LYTFHFWPAMVVVARTLALPWASQLLLGLLVSFVLHC